MEILAWSHDSITQSNTTMFYKQRAPKKKRMLEQKLLEAMKTCEKTACKNNTAELMTETLVLDKLIYSPRNMGFDA